MFVQAAPAAEGEGVEAVNETFRIIVMKITHKKYTFDFEGKPITMLFSPLADQANGAVIAQYGNTTVLATAVMGKKDESLNYFPLMVEYEEKHYSIGKILGSRYTRREGRSSDEAVLSGRMIDRTIRPLFNHAMRRKVQVVLTILEWGSHAEADMMTMLAASTALAVSDIPWNGPVAGVVIDEPSFHAFVAGTEERVNMVELEGKEADEADIVRAFEKAQKQIAELAMFQKKIVKEIGKEKAEVALMEPDAELGKAISAFLKGKLGKAVFIKEKKEQYAAIAALKDELLAHLRERGAEEETLGGVEYFYEKELDALVHEKALKDGMRPDGRAFDEVRDLHAEVDLLARTHGSALFVRGNTQALGVVTLGAPDAYKLMETVEFSGEQRFMLNYNFPGYSVGEVGFFRGPGRREIGHGALAEKALKNLIPEKEAFPYAIRVVSEILGSNGSSSMASVCAGSMALMAAGVPMKKAAAGIAMGLMSDGGGNYKILTDIQGPEDHYGDMDFKVAGTKDGVTALQMDVKIEGATPEILKEALTQAKKARLHILEAMAKAIKEPRKELAPNAPLILTMRIDTEKIGEVIGPGGKVINGIREKTGVVAIDIEDDGMIYITGDNRESAQAAYDQIKNIVKEFEIGELIHGEVIKILEFGAIVDLGGGRDGMIHVSELKEGFVKNVTDVVNMGDKVWAKVIKKERGKLGLSMKGVPQKQ